MKKHLIILICLIVAFAFCACDNNTKNKKQPEYKIGCIYPGPDENKEAKSFVAKVIDEDTSHMIVEPMKWEDEYEVSKEIKIDYGTDHIDYLYGIGRRIVIYYDGKIDRKDGAVIYTDDISTEGFREFEVIVDYNMNRGEQIILSSEEIDAFDDFPHNSDRNLYYFNTDVSIDIDGEIVPLESAVRDGKITLDGIITRANEDVINKKIKEITYKDGGTKEYIYPDYKMIVYHTIDGNRDVYFTIYDFGVNDM